MTERMLIAGIGNIFLGDDAFGIEVVQRCAGRWPSSVRVTDFGIRGFDLAYALMNGPEFAILVDAAKRGGSPGTLYLIAPDLPGGAAPEQGSFEGHSLTLEHVFRLVTTMGGSLPRLLVVGCEPTPLSQEEEEFGCAGLSPAVQDAVPEAICLIESVVQKFLTESAALAPIPPALQLTGPIEGESLQKGGLA